MYQINTCKNNIKETSTKERQRTEYTPRSQIICRRKIPSVQKIVSWFPLFLITLLVVAYISYRQVQANPVVVFHKVEEQFNPTEPQKIDDTFWEEEVYDPLTYALFLSAESDYYRKSPNPVRLETLHSYGSWLLENSDRNENGTPGYGLEIEHQGLPEMTLDSGTEYTVTSAIVINSLLDWAEVDKTAPAKEINELCLQILDPYMNGDAINDNGLAQSVITDENHEYSVINATFLIASQAQRLSSIITDTEDIDALLEFSNTQISILLNHRIETTDSIYWTYAVNTDQQNDLVHAAYIVYAAIIYQRYGGSRISQNQLLKIQNHLLSFSDNERWYQYPSIDGSRLSDQEPIVWGMGMLLKVLSEQETHGALLRDAFSFTMNYYDYQGAFSHDFAERSSYLRENAFILLGIEAVLDDQIINNILIRTTQ